MRRDQDRLSETLQLLHDRLELGTRARIQTGRRLVEQQHFRIVQHGAREQHALPLPFRKSADRILRARRHAHEIERVGDDAAGAGLRTVEREEELEILLDGERVVGRESLGHVSERARRRATVVDDVVTRDSRDAAVRPLDARENSQRGRLPRAVRAEETADFAALDEQVDAGERREIAIALHEPARFDRRDAHRFSRTRTMIQPSSAGAM